MTCPYECSGESLYVQQWTLQNVYRYEPCGRLALKFKTLQTRSTGERTYNLSMYQLKALVIVQGLILNCAA